jgi:hypothetical protein
MKPGRCLKDFSGKMRQGKTGVRASIGDHGTISIRLYQDDDHTSVGQRKGHAVSANAGVRERLQMRSAKRVVAYAPHKMYRQTTLCQPRGLICP